MNTDSDTAARQPAERGVRVTEAHRAKAREVLSEVAQQNPVTPETVIARALAEAEARERERLEALRREFEAIWLRNWNEKFDPDIPLDEADQTRLHQIRLEFNNPRRTL